MADALIFPDGSALAITRSASETGGRLLEMEVTLPSSYRSPPRHFHPEQEESYEVLDGALSVFRGNRWHTLSRGESIAVPAGVVHTFANRSSEPVRFTNRFTPARPFQDLVERFSDLLRSGAIRRPRSPSVFVSFAMITKENPQAAVYTSPLLRGVMSLLAAAGRLLGYRTG